jgi:hypothetical protein
MRDFKRRKGGRENDIVAKITNQIERLSLETAHYK